ncbi:MAG: DNA-processing protein DprA, partial [Methylococcales bacterium]|nr:DNA-processing protein DprA [Methylococcales bacterium]
MKYWLGLLRVSGVGCKTFLKILDQCPPESLFTESTTSLKALGLSDKIIRGIKNPNWAVVDKDLAWLSMENNHVLTLDDAFYPQQLKQIPDPPPLLFLRGQKQLLSSRQIAIVGSRNPSTEGRRIAYDFAYHLANEGFTITSGLALGIDACSHQGALKVTGNTIAVAGTGLDRVYPASHKALATEIVDKGVMISEFPPGTNAMAANFPRRNRIISGLCLGLLVVEAAKKSGSLISARLALEQNRDVFAIPGSIYNPLARGCNGLIRQGAKLVETTEDILEELNEYNQYDSISEPINNQSELDLAQQNLLNLIMFSPTSVDVLVEESGISANIISSMLLILELQGYISSAAGGGYLRIK